MYTLTRPTATSAASPIRDLLELILGCSVRGLIITADDSQSLLHVVRKVCTMAVKPALVKLY